MPKLLIIRHSRSVANQQGILMGGKLDSPLSDEGREIARHKGATLKAAGFMPVQAYTSKLLRAKQTLQIILEELGVSPTIIELDQLNERDFGVHDGKPYEHILSALANEGPNPKTVETVEAVIARVTKAFDQIKQEITGTTLVVSHSSPVLIMQTLAENLDNLQNFWQRKDPPYCEGFEISTGDPNTMIPNKDTRVVNSSKLCLPS